MIYYTWNFPKVTSTFDKMNHYGVKGEAFQYKAAYDSAGCKVTKFIQTVYNILQVTFCFLI